MLKQKMNEYATLNVGQLKQLLDGHDDDQEIRIWVEETNDDGVTYLSGRRLIGAADDGDLCCLMAAYYKNEEEEE